MKINWHKLTKWHWRTDVAGKRLDFYPTKRKWQYAGEWHEGDVGAFIKKIETGGYSKEEKSVEKQAWWSYCKVDDSIRVYIVHEGRSKSDAAPDVLKALQAARISYQSAV